MKSLRLLVCWVIITSQVLTPTVASASPLVSDTPPTGGSSTSGSSTPSPPKPSPPSNPNPPSNTSPPSTGGTSTGGSSGGTSTGGSSGGVITGGSQDDEGKSNSGGGVGKERGNMDCGISETGLSCEYDMYVEQNMTVNGTILQSVNNLNPAIHWTPKLEELEGLKERILIGYDPVPKKNLLLKEGEDPTQEYYGAIKDIVDNEILVTTDNDRYYYHAETIVDVGRLNNIFEYKPAREIDAVYTGEFDLNRKTRAASMDISRETEILGGDILVWDDGYDFLRERYIYKEMKSSRITKAQAVNAIYKTFPKTSMYRVNQMQYALNLEDGKEDGTDENGNKLVAVGNTPFVTSIPITHAFINANTYYTRTYVSRNLIDVYWEKSVNAGLMSLFEKNETIKLSEFVLLVADMLHTNGEEVLNEAEQNLLVAVYGKDLPYYLESRYLEAVRYLVARGIVEPTMAYDEPLTTKDLTDILMRTHDKDSRLDFKKINFEYSEDLVAMGYYPTNTVISESPIEDLRVISGNSTASHYDYFVEKIGWIEEATGKRNQHYTTFYQTDVEGYRREVSTMYIPTKHGYVTYDKVPDTHYLGIVEEEGKQYYHFQVPVDIEDFKRLRVTSEGKIEEDRAVDEEGYLNVNTLGMSDVPLRWELQIGGGIYTEPKGDSKYIVSMDSKPIPSTWSSTYTDRTRKQAAQRAENLVQPLNNGGTEFKFNSSAVGIASLMWKGKKIEDADTDTFKDHGDGSYSIFVKGADPYKELMKHLTYSSNLPSEQVVSAYVKDGRYALVSMNWLKKNKIVNDIVEIEKGKKWVLYSNRDNILIDLENRRIVSGQVVTEIMKTDESPLITVDPFSKEILVDYRAIGGIASDYLVVKDENGNITLSTDSRVLTKSTSKQVFNLTGTSGTPVDAIVDRNNSNKFLLSLESSYPIANYLIYRSRKNNVRQDYMVVAKPALSGADDTANKQLKDFTDLEFSDNVDVDVWAIGDKIITDPNDTSAVKHTDKVIFHPETQEYHYDVPRPDPKTLTAVFTNYMKKEGDVNNPLPLIAVSDKVIDLNINIMSTDSSKPYDLSLYPSNMQNPSIITKFLGSNKVVKLGETQKLSVNGITGLYYPYGEVSWDKLVRTKGVVYIGSVPVALSKKDHEKVTEYIRVSPLSNANIEYVSIQKADYGSEIFTEVFRGRTRSIYSYDLQTQANLTGYDDLGSKAWGDLIEGISTKTRGVFDFFQALREDFFGTLNDSLSLIILNLILVVPRVMLVWFMLYLALSFAHGSRFMGLLCEKTIDIYKVLSLGLSDVNRLHPQSVWISTFIGIVLSVAMVQNGSFINLLGWIVTSILKAFG